jgi:alpha-galactosidase
LSEGEYRNLYDIAFDLPETHAVAKEDTLYYSLFSRDPYTGTFHLRGLGGGQYSVANAVTGESMGMMAGSKASVGLSFKGVMLLKAEPR